ncbi:hypothetical protein BpHYR1_025723 [Brachionus plicatilis]|uniref:Uncharacterized protein n=1 Tax=Brachionus plicatilis TaxID=10195 RepID=A0A3M7SKA4_BRAPC|nr:hypothetical protein BpHYR1_025723 [Brachionus plicatilis]
MSPNQHLAAINSRDRIFAVNVNGPLGGSDKNTCTTSSPGISPPPVAHSYLPVLNPAGRTSSLNNPIIDVNYEALLSAYNSGVSKFVPSYTNSPVSIANKQSPKWFNKTLKKLTQLKYKLFICTRNHPGNSDSWFSKIKQITSALLPSSP